MVTKSTLKRDFSIIPNDLICDSGLSNAAHRVAMYLFSRPDNWNINNTDIMRNTGIKSDDTMAKALKELVNNGWISRERQQDEAGKLLGGYDYTLNAIRTLPITEKNRIPKNSVYGKNTVHSNTDSINKKELVREKAPEPQKTEPQQHETHLSAQAVEIGDRNVEAAKGAYIDKLKSNNSAAFYYLINNVCKLPVNNKTLLWEWVNDRLATCIRWYLSEGKIFKVGSERQLKNTFELWIAKDPAKSYNEFVANRPTAQPKQIENKPDVIVKTKPYASKVNRP